MNINQLLVGTLLLFMLPACANEATEEKQLDLLAGRWNLVEGMRNGKVTDSLRDTYFEFTKEGNMSTNLPIPGGKDSTFEIAENVIIQTIVNDMKLNYAIEELTNNSLKLSTKLRNYDFVFSLEKEKAKGLSLLTTKVVTEGRKNSL